MEVQMKKELSIDIRLLAILGAILCIIMMWAFARIDGFEGVVQAGFIELFIGLVGIEIHKTTNGTGNYTVEIWAAGKKDTKEAYTTLRDEIRAMQEHITPTN